MLRLAVVASLLALAAASWLRERNAFQSLKQLEPPRRRLRPHPSLPPSIVALPVRVPLDDVRALATRVIPKVLMRQEGVGVSMGLIMDLLVERDGPFAVEADEEGLRFRAPVRFQVKAHWEGPFGMSATRDMQGRFRVTGRTQVAVERDWRIRAQTALGMVWDEKPQLSIGGVTVSLAGIVEKTIRRQLLAFSRKLDARLNDRIRLRRRVEGHWKILQEPRSLALPSPAWLVIRPERIALSPVRGEGQELRLDLSLLCHPGISAGSSPVSSAPRPLPDLDERLPGGGEGVTLHLPLEVSYVELGRIAFAHLADRVLPLPDGSTLQVTALQLRGNGDRLELSVSLVARDREGKARAEGTVWLQGRPDWKTEERVLSVRDLDFAPETSQPLLREAAWLAQSAFRRWLSEGIRLPMGARLDEARLRMSEALKDRPLGEDARLKGQIDAFAVAGIWVGPEGVEVTVEGRGKLQVALRLQRLGRKESEHDG